MAEHLSFKFKEVRIGPFRTQRPLLAVKLAGPSGAVTTVMLVDSGADVSMIQLDLAEHLGLPLGKGERTGGISGGLDVFRTRVQCLAIHPGDRGLLCLGSGTDSGPIAGFSEARREGTKESLGRPSRCAPSMRLPRRSCPCSACRDRQSHAS